MPIPDFLIVGAMKSGTGGLFQYLVLHNEVCPPQPSPGRYAKEITFFTVNRAGYDLNGYKYLFRAATNGQLTFEASTDYLNTPLVPEAVRRMNPDCKIIIMMRNPIDRAWSHYWHERIYTKSENLPFEEAIQRNGTDATHYYHWDYLGMGHYLEHIKRWQEHFKDIFIIHAEAFFKHPEATFLEVQRFLGITQGTLDKYELINKGTYKRHMSKKTRQKLVEYYKPHNENLYEFLGRDLGWS